jgi:hypothetical protein
MPLPGFTLLLDAPKDGNQAAVSRAGLAAVQHRPGMNCPGYMTAPDESGFEL